MLFVSKCDIDGLCVPGQIFTEGEMVTLMWEVDCVDCVACATEYAAEIWRDLILEESVKITRLSARPSKPKSMA